MTSERRPCPRRRSRCARIERREWWFEDSRADLERVARICTRLAVTTVRRRFERTGKRQEIERMCGRGGVDYDWKTLWAWLQLPGSAPSGHVRRLNLAPSTRRSDGVHWSRLPVVRADGDDGRRVDELVWPLIPPWLKGELPKFSTANCRSEADLPFSEVVQRKPAFRNAWRRGQRCLVPMSWFYEWDKRKRPSEPWRILPVGDPLLVMAGLWDRSPAPDGSAIESFTILTTGPNRLLAEIGHDRAPVLLRHDAFSTWLQGSDAEAEALITPPADDLLQAHRVTLRVNNPEYQGEDLLEPATPPTGHEAG